MEKRQGRNRLIGGVALIIIGLILLVAQFVELGEWAPLSILLALGLIFIAWGLFTRQSGLLIPGGILSGLGAGTLLITGPFENAAGDVQGGIFVLAFAAGWMLIPVLSALVSRDNHWWALIPGAILALIGGGLLFGGVLLDALAWLGKIWPAFFILIGLYLIFRRSVGKAS